MTFPAQIIDKFGREHDYLRISLTERCNLRCAYCMPAEGIQLRDKAEFMRTEELLFLAKEFVELGVKKIRLTGGEPLIKNNFEQIIKGLTSLNVEVGITTNAVLLDKYIDVLWEAGIRSLNVSLDSLSEKRFNKISRRNFFQRIKSNIDLCLSKGFKMKINVVVMRDFNDDEIVNFIQWSRNSPVHIRFIEFMPFDGNKWNWKTKVSHQEIMNRVYSFYGNEEVYKLEDEKNGTARIYQVLGSVGTFGIISSVTNPFCDTCNRIRLTADGKIKNCLFSQDETDLLSEIRNGKRENVKPIILNSILSKKKQHGGITDFGTITSSEIKNRTMVSIGG